ncbi:hypothetical protein [Pseudoalteromonas atlantica]|uniref:hypothetical protein n=1 Tax=Pseudoalteromonas atlantica TaxID=288 RepID=UPI0037368924
MKNKLFIFVLLALSFCCTSVMAKNTFSAGAGFYEFGGHAGVKYKYSIDDLHALSAAVGVVGYSVGYEYSMSAYTTVGFSAGQQVAVAEDGYVVAKLNYYFQGIDNTSWILGLSAGVKEEDGDCLVFCEKKDTEQIEGTVGIHVGYQF